MIELLRNCEVFAPERLGTRDLLVANGKLAWIGKDAAPLPEAYGAAEHDLGGARVVPGLIDGHVHLTGGGGEAGPHTRVPPLSLTRFTRAGITTVVGLLGTDDVTRSTADLLAAARGLAAEGLDAFCLTGGYHLPPTTLTGSVRGDIVHVERILGAGEIAISDHRSSQPTRDELLRVASDCHVAGLMTGKAGHLHLHLGDGRRGLQPVREALEHSELPPAVFHPTHVNRQKALFQEALELVEHGCVIDVTAFPAVDSQDELTASEAITRFLDAGLPAERLTVSSDGGGCLPQFDGEGRVTRMDVGRPATLADTLAELLAAGRPLEQVLPPFTSNVARLLRLPAKGRIAPGTDADLVVLDAGHRIEHVMVRGRWHVWRGEPRIHGTFEKPASAAREET